MSHLRRRLVAAVVLATLTAACASSLNEQELATTQGALREELDLRGPAAAGGRTGDLGPIGDTTGGADLNVGDGPATDGGAASPGTGGSAGGTGGSVGSGSSTSSGAGGKKSEIVFGSIQTTSGPIGANVAGMNAGLRAWVGAVNAKGGLNGHPVRVVIADDGGDPARAVALARQMVEEQGVKAFIAEASPTTLQALIPFLEANDLALVGPSGGNPLADRTPNVFNPYTGTEYGIAWAFALMTKETGGKTAALVYCRELNTCPQLNTHVGRYLEQLGIKLVYNAQASMAQPDFTAEIIGAKNAGAETVVAIMDGPSVLRLRRAAVRQGYSPKWAAALSIHTDEFAREPDADGLISAATAVNYSTSPLLEEMRQAVARYAPDKRGNGGFVTQAWLAGKLYERVARHFPENPTSKDILEAFYKESNMELDPPGLTPKLTFNRGPHKAINLCFVVIKVQNGTWVDARGRDEYVCAPGYVPGNPTASEGAT